MNYFFTLCHFFSKLLLSLQWAIGVFLHLREVGVICSLTCTCLYGGGCQLVVLGELSVLGCGGVRRTSLRFSPGIGYFVKRGKVKGAGLLSTVCCLSFYGDSSGPVSSRIVHRSDSFFIIRKLCRSRRNARRSVCYNVGHQRGGAFGHGGGTCRHFSRRMNFVPLIVISPSSNRLVLKNDRRHHQFVSITVSRRSGRCLTRLVGCSGTLRRHGTLLGRRRRPSTRLLTL